MSRVQPKQVSIQARLTCCKSIKWKRKGQCILGNRGALTRDSPILVAIQEICSEYYNKQAQEPRLTSFISGDKNMIQAFQEGKDIYASIASRAFNVPYEKCLEFHPETHEYQPDGKARRGEAKTILLG